MITGSKARFAHLHELHTGRDIYCDLSAIRFLFASDSVSEGYFAAGGDYRPVMFRETADEIFAELDRAQMAIFDDQMELKALTAERDDELFEARLAHRSKKNDEVK